MKRRIFLILIALVLIAGLASAQGAIKPKEGRAKYLFAFSQCTMNHPWRVTFTNDMELWAQKMGVDLVWLDGNNDAADQLNDIQDLLSKNPDLLFVSPLQAEPLTPALDWARQKGVPVIAIDRTFAVEPDGKSYLAFLGADLAQQNYTNMKIMADKLKKKYGSAKGKLVELRGTTGSGADNDQKRGLDMALMEFPSVKVIASQSGDYLRSNALRITENWLKMYPKGSIDGIVAYNDEMALGAIQAIKEAGRTELLGWITGVNGQREALKAIMDGELLASNMNGPYWGEASLKLAMEYVQKGKLAQKYYSLPIPQYRGDVANEIKRAKEAYDYTVFNNAQYPPITLWVDVGRKLKLPTGLVYPMPAK